MCCAVLDQTGALGFLFYEQRAGASSKTVRVKWAFSRVLHGIFSCGDSKQEISEIRFIHEYCLTGPNSFKIIEGAIQILWGRKAYNDPNCYNFWVDFWENG